MIKQFTRRISSVSPPVAIIGVLIIVLAGAGGALLFTRSHSEANSEAIQPYAARIDRVDGSVGIARAEDTNKQVDWAQATLNTPVTVGDRIYARDNSRASIALSGHDYVRLNPATALDVLSLQDRRTQLALRSGSALFDVGSLGRNDLYEVGTPYGAVDFVEPGLYQVGLDGNSAIISVLSGLAQVVGAGGSGYISKGQVFTLAAAAAAEVLASRLAPRSAGSIVDDYYRYRYPSAYGGRYLNYDAYLDDPFYYDPYRTSASCHYLPADIPGVYDLDPYGDWVNLTDYGYSWAPRVSAGWAPYRSGFWDFDNLWGPSWVSSEPWGWAPYHYGRWAFVDRRWFWIPAEVRTQPVYSPAPVAFFPFSQQVAWVPLAPGESYVPRYYDVDFTPRYLASPEVINVATVQRTFVNFNAPGAVTVVPVRMLTHEIDPGVITTVDPRVIESSRPVLDPLSVDGIRQVAMSRRDARLRMRFERAEQEAFNVPVLTSAAPEALRVRSDTANALRVEALPEKQKKNKLKINETGEVTSLRHDGLPQPAAASQQRMAELATRAEQGDRSARREMRQLMREEQRTASEQQQAQQEQTRQQMKEQRKAERQQQAQAAAQQEAARQAQQQQTREQRKAERQQQAQAAAQQEAARQTQQQQTREQRKAERQQQAQAAAQQEAARQAQQQQMRQQRKAERQQQQPQRQMRQQEQIRQQRKEQKRLERKPPEAFVQQQRQTEQARIQRAQQQAAQIAQQREQFKAQKRAERQAMLQQQTARAQAAQNQVMMQQREQFKAQKRAEREAAMQQQAARAQAAQGRAMMQQREQFKAQKRAEREAAMQQQAARAQAAQSQAVSPRAPAHSGPPVSVNGASRAERKAEKAQRKQSQQ